MDACCSISPELWNFTAVLIAAALTLWSCRFFCFLIEYVDLHAADRREAVICLKDLGPSLNVLSQASMWHFQQLLLTKFEAIPIPMSRIRVPFEVKGGSLQLRTYTGQPQTLSFNFSTKVKCAVQVFWGLHVNALERECLQAAKTVNIANIEHKTPVQKRVTNKASLSEKLSKVGLLPSLQIALQSRRHRLTDVSDEPMSTFDSQKSIKKLNVSNESTFFSKSEIHRFHIGEHFFEMPVDSKAREYLKRVKRPQRENDLEETTKENCTESPRHEERFPVVVALYATINQDSVIPNQSHQFEDAICQCVLIDFLPTPTKQEGENLVILKRVNFTPTSGYVPNEIFGRDLSSEECVICLEKIRMVTLLPCRHFCVCSTCLDEIDRCPICRTQFSTYAIYKEDDRCKACDELSVGVEVI